MDNKMVKVTIGDSTKEYPKGIRFADVVKEYEIGRAHV